MYPLSDMQIEELFQRFLVDNDHFDHDYLELCVYLVKKGRIDDFKHVFNRYSFKCLMHNGFGTDDITDVLAYSIIHNLPEVFNYIYDRVWVDTSYAHLIIQYKRSDMLIAMIKHNILDDGNTELLEMIHEKFLDFEDSWYDGENTAFFYSKNTDIHDKYLRAF